MAQILEQPPQQMWQYNQRTGQLRAPDGTIQQARGYSGAPGYINTPEVEDRRNQGPIPRGAWEIGSRDIGTRGPLTLELTPVDHNAHGRTEFRIHGDSRRAPGTASEGCIILNNGQRQRILDSGIRRLQVVDEPEWQR